MCLFRKFVGMLVELEANSKGLHLYISSRRDRVDEFASAEEFGLKWSLFQRFVTRRKGKGCERHGDSCAVNKAPMAMHVGQNRDVLTLKFLANHSQKQVKHALPDQGSEAVTG